MMPPSVQRIQCRHVEFDCGIRPDIFLVNFAVVANGFDDIDHEGWVMPAFAGSHLQTWGRRAMFGSLDDIISSTFSDVTPSSSALMMP
jgi:hypothetical protein